MSVMVTMFYGWEKVVLGAYILDPLPRVGELMLIPSIFDEGLIEGSTRDLQVQSILHVIDSRCAGNTVRVTLDEVDNDTRKSK